MTFFFIKLIHILSATVMIGAGLGSAFYLFLAYKKTSVSTVKDVLKLVILADKIFTLPSIIIQLFTGLILANYLNLLTSVWLRVVFVVSLVILGCWVRAAFIQIKLEKIIIKENEIGLSFHQLMREWFYLGLVSFLGAVYLYYLMVFKPFI